MTKLELIAVLKLIWQSRYIIAGTMILTGILDLLGITLGDFGSGFVIGGGLLILFGIIDTIAKKSKK